MTPAGLRLGAPGVYRDGRRPPPAFQPLRLDIAGFVGVAPRGPVDTPVAVDRWSDYVLRFGGFEGPGLLPYAVRAFFAQGGARAHVLRVAPLPRSPHPAALAACALHRIRLARADGPAAASGGGRPCDVHLRARDEGSWGGRLSVRWDFTGAGHFTATANGRELTLPEGLTPPDGSLLRLRAPGLGPAGGFFSILEQAVRQDTPGLRRRIAVLDRQPGPGTRPVDVDAELVTATVTITDTDPAYPRQERFAGLGLNRAHKRFAADVLATESLFTTPDGEWPEALLPPDVFLASVESAVVRGRGGEDRYAGINADSFHGTTPVELLPIGGGESTEDPSREEVGMDRLALVPEVALLSVPDLLWFHSDAPETTTETPSRPGSPVFVPCPPRPEPMTVTAPRQQALLLDSGTQLPEIVRRQQRLAALAERQRRFVALLDVPPGLPVRAVARWRAGFESSYTAAYHPWLGVVAPDEPQHRAVSVPPSAFAAGIIAERERRLGLHWGPANALAAEAVTSAERIGEADHDELHLLDIDVFRGERDGFRLASARTLSRDPDYRQLSVRRLMTMLRLVLDRQAQPLAFEPHSARLRSELIGSITELLRGLYRSGALAGESEDEAFFVTCDERLNPGWSLGRGRLVAEVGVAPARPLEHLVLRIAQDADGAVTVV